MTKSTANALRIVFPFMALLLSSGFGFGCASQQDSTPSKEPNAYPPGPYRNRPSDLHAVAQSVSHLVVSHRDSGALTAIQGTPLWLPLRESERTREQAETLARALARRVEAGEDFAALARELSDDQATAPLAGAMGVVYATALPYEYLDALWALEDGQVSRVIETRAGFHLLRRDPVPEEEVSFGMLVVKYDGVAGFWRPGREQPRSREQAHALAQKLAREATAAPGHFAELVARHGDEFGANPAGNRGPWARRDAFPLPTVLHASAQLELGAISGVLDTPLGFVIAQRQALPAEETLAASVIAIGYAGAPVEVEEETTRTRAEASELVASLMEELRQRPERFDELRAQHCPSTLCEPRAWRGGRGDFGLDGVTRGLSVGHIRGRAFEAPPGFLIVKRESVEKHPLVDASVELTLPDIKPLGIEDFLQRVSAQDLAIGFMRFSFSAAQQLELQGAELESFKDLTHNVADQLLSGELAERRQALAVYHTEVASLLGPERFATLEQHRERWLLDIQQWRQL